MVKKKSNKRVGSSRKRIYTLIAAVALIVVVVAAALYYVTARTDIVRITRFAKATESRIPDQVIYGFAITIENQGMNDVSGLVLRVRLLGDGVQIIEESVSLPTVPRGQKYSPAEVGLTANLTDIAGKTVGFSASLYLNSRTVDEAVA